MKLVDYLVKGDYIVIGDYNYTYDSDALRFASAKDVECVFTADSDYDLRVSMDLNQEVSVQGSDAHACVVASVRYSGLSASEESHIHIYKSINIFEVS